MMGQTCWTSEYSEALRSHIEIGHSYREAAVAINKKFGTNFTRNSAIGRGSRMEIKAPSRPGDNGKKPIMPKRTESEARPRPDVTIQARAEPPRIPRAEVELRCAAIEPRLVSLIELEPGDCRYPYGEGPYLFCGHQKQEGSSYCTAHFQLTAGERRGRHEMPQHVAAALRRSHGNGKVTLRGLETRENIAL